MFTMRMCAGAIATLHTATFSLTWAQAPERPPEAAQSTREDRPAQKPDFPSWKEVSEGYERVVTGPETETLYGIWVRQKDSQMLAELPRGWANQRHLFAMTLPTGETFAGLQAGERYVYWKRFDKRLALIEPQISVRASGDRETQEAITRTFVDRVLLDIPIVCMGPNGQPVIDMDELLVGNLSTFYGGRLAAGAKRQLATIKKAKAFPQNVVLSFEVPVGDGAVKTFDYSISLIPDNTGYKPRKADERVGYFTVSFRDLSKYRHDEVWTRYITRWHLEKRDPNLRLSPPKRPIIFYVEHTTPPRYRRWIREGVLYWNKAFEKVGIVDAIEVYYQDKETGAHMDKDPEDVRYNFIRWVANDVGTAIGPSRTHPLTGEILDADIILTDGWIRHFWYQANEFLPQVNAAMEGMSAETLAWLDRNPQWDPRVRLAPPEERERILAERLQAAARGFNPPAPGVDAATLNDPSFQRLADILSPTVGLCMAAYGKASDMTLLGLHLECAGVLEALQPSDGDKKDEKKKEDKGDLIDGIPEWFLGPMLADLTAHEVGHTLGLRHNFKASAIYPLSQINSPAVKGTKPFAGSVMDYIPVNIHMEGDGETQGDYTMIGVGPYDVWAIEYGYTSGDPKDVLRRVSEPELAYATDEDTPGPDPLARRYDLSTDPRDYAISRMKLARFHRERILEKFVKEGESWARARRGYQITLTTQVDAINIMANWLGGSFVVRDKKGDPGNRTPVTPVPAAAQRAALKFVIDNAFFDEAFGLTPELLQKMTVDKWMDPGGRPFEEPTWPVHDRIMGIQAAALTMLMNPTTLRRVYDNEFLVPAGEDALTLPELLETITAAIWGELDASPDKRYTAREPLISSLRRNLQREHADRLIDLALGNGPPGVAGKTTATLATQKLREIRERIATLLGKHSARLDPYTIAHLSDIRTRIEKALEAQYFYGSSGMGSGFGFPIFFTTPPPAPLAEDQHRR